MFIYNWEREEWRQQLDLPLNNMTHSACGKIKDPYTDRLWILIAGGFDPIREKNTDQVWLWDPESNEVQAGPEIPKANDGMHIIEYAETEILMLSGYHGDHTILSFSFETGWQTWGNTINDISFAAAILVPKYFGGCS